jgi:iron complex outermembrane receptor protein
MQFNSNVYDLQVSLDWQIDQEKSLRLDANYFRDQDDEDKTGPANAIVGERKADAVPAEQVSPFFPTGKFADPQESKNLQLTYDDSDVLGSAVTVQGFWQQWENETFVDFRSFGACCVLDFGTDKRIDRRLGTRVNIDSPFEYGPLPNGTRLVWGGDYLNLFNSELIDSRVAGTEVGTRPDITQNSVAGFAQLEVPVGEFLVSGGARHEVFFVDFDDQLRSDGTRFQGGGIQYDATLANLGLVYYLTDTVELFGGWSQGFDVTEAGRAASQVDTVDQIELEPAVTDQFELGVRVFESSWDASLTGFYTESELASRTQINPNGSLAIPLRQPEQIWGLEATLNTTINPEWTLGGTLHFQEGTREVDGDTKRVQSRFIQPWRVTGYAEYEPFDWFSNRLQFSFAPGHDRFPGSTAFGEGEVSDLFLLDYFASFQTDYGEFRLGVENITNEQYIPQFREATNLASQYYAAQGRTVRLTYRVQF